jgi:alcohol dehydrogenase (cytochrome c)
MKSPVIAGFLWRMRMRANIPRTPLQLTRRLARGAVLATAILAGGAGLVFAQANSGDWRSYGQNSLGWRYSQLAQIDTRNVSRLSTAWIYQTGLGGGFETTPLVFDGLMFIAGPSNHSWALDALTGRPVWHAQKMPPAKLNLCCGSVNRGFAARGDKLFRVNIEGTLVAIDAKSGTTLWETTMADYSQGYSATAAPLIVKNLVVTGTAGAEFGTRGFIDAYDADTGKRVWRFNTVPGEGEPGNDTWSGDSWKRGGASTWVTGTYDPELNLIFWGTGNPGPDMDGDVRRGDNLYSCSIVALDADTGTLKWYYQFTPHDVHDWDAISDPVLVDLSIEGRKVKALLQANRNGFFYALDRTNGKVLKAKPYTEVSWAEGIGADGRPILIKDQEPTEEGKLTCPGLGGGHNWQATAYSPRTGLYYFPSTESCHLFYKSKQEFTEGQWYQASNVEGPPQSHGTGAILAVDPTTAGTKWRFDMVSPPSAGILATAGGLVFTGDRQGYLIALDDRTGKVLWKFQTGGPVVAPPISYTLEGKQYIAIAAGGSILTFALR